MTLPKTAPNADRDNGRLRIAQMLHDGPCQTFSSAQLLAEVLLREAEAEIAGDASLHKELAAGIRAGVNELHEILVALRKEGLQPE